MIVKQPGAASQSSQITLFSATAHDVSLASRGLERKCVRYPGEDATGRLKEAGVRAHSESQRCAS